jgi:hypothetical protein
MRIASIAYVFALMEQFYTCQAGFHALFSENLLLRVQTGRHIRSAATNLSI